ncbi:MAG: helix-turn-helix transcriptional regulator [Deltaproteobacteria bacterium]|nr:helix-turn-helix transcriptional regulator [Deltaproteobacteria bacterium]
MVQYSSDRLNASFAALSDATRRGVLDQLGRADASISDLAEVFNMTLTGMKKHVGVLEQAGLVSTEKVGRNEHEVQMDLVDRVRSLPILRHRPNSTASLLKGFA